MSAVDRDSDVRPSVGLGRVRPVRRPVPTAWVAVVAVASVVAGCAGSDDAGSSVPPVSTSDTVASPDSITTGSDVFDRVTDGNDPADPLGSPSSDPADVPDDDAPDETGSVASGEPDPTTEAGDPSGSSDGPATTSGEVVAGDPSATPAPGAEDPTASPTTAISAAGSDTADCLVGDWVVTGRELSDYYDLVAEESGFSSIESAGSFGFGFTGSAVTFAFDVDLDLTSDVEDDPIDDTFGLTGQTIADYVVDGDLLRDPDGDPQDSGTTVSRSEVTRDGAPLADVGDLLVGIVPARPFENGVPFSCSGPSIVLPAGTTGMSAELDLTPA